MEEAKNTTVEETVTNNATEETTKPGFGEKCAAGATAAYGFVEKTVTEKVGAYKEDPLKEVFKDLMVGAAFYVTCKGIKAGVKGVAKLFKKKD